MSDDLPSLVSTDWLAERLGNPRLIVLDATRHLPAAKRDARTEYDNGHIPGARFLDLASLTDAASDVPAALPNAAQLAERLASLGVKLGDHVVIYDDSAVKTSSRAWFTLVAHGFDTAAILDGGLAKWRAEGRAVESGPVSFEPSSPVNLTEAERVAGKAEILTVIEDHTDQILDARGADRVFGSGIDPVHGGQNGRIPGSLNLPFGQVFKEDGTFKAPADLRSAFKAAGVDLDQPLITSCGSGVTASVLLFAAHLAGKDDVRLYDGSWQEWEADPATPKQQGPA